MKAIGILRRIDELGRVVVSKEIRKVLRIREGDPSHNSLTLLTSFVGLYIVWWKDTKNKRGEIHLAFVLLV